MNEPDRLDHFIAALDALYTRRDELTARLDELRQKEGPKERSAEEQAQIANIELEYSQIDERIAVLKERLEGAGKASQQHTNER